ncbi:MAG: Cd(II)/Pb(II)-responsive transcriptional regulator [Betaproteobacteria bacterium]|nr:Cd(II)/Pb(II)-responsive transcriptional regulator [Betaproteobacteria bacterium]
MRIGELARAAGTDVETIRYYEKAGLIPAPPRTAGNYRHYGPDHAARLAFIRHCRALDMSLDEVRALLAFSDAPERECAGVNALLEAHIGHVVQRIAELQDLERTLRRLRRQCAKASRVADCGILDGLRSPRADAPPVTKKSHVGRSHQRAQGRA